MPTVVKSKRIPITKVQVEGASNHNSSLKKCRLTLGKNSYFDEGLEFFSLASVLERGDKIHLLGEIVAEKTRYNFHGIFNSREGIGQIFM